MSPRPWEQDSSSKKKEMVSYKILGLGREMKSKRRRTAAEDAGLYRYIGEGTAERPWLKVTRMDYLVTRRVVMIELLGNRSARDADRLKIERKTYDLMARRQEAATGLQESFRQAHGRGMTPRELELYSRAGGMEGKGRDPKAAADGIRKRLLAEVVEKVENRARGGQMRLQEAWAAAAGEESAQEAILDRVDGLKGVAYLRCLSSTRRHELARREDLKTKLSEKLGVKIRRLAFR
ncbi:MAG: hypothetical protein EBZ53_06410 [Verrucomicrobia bacterium]|nr:hypothetical protein [Verrucomicrobiota bacterium]NDA25958.1 hypothetical protein [Verrucomicrobiota bacterium]NDD82176.1 hypothetical protein [Verrucomicrobiota bacterium]